VTLRSGLCHAPWPRAGRFDSLRIFSGSIVFPRGLRLDTHPYQLYLQLNEIEHTKTKARRPQTNGTCERFHRTVQDEFYKPAFRRKMYRTLEELQDDLDAFLRRYNEERTHQGKRCQGRTPMQTFLDSKPLAEEKRIA
jgi:transposase